MKQVQKRSINREQRFVAAYNADAFYIENKEMENEVFRCMRDVVTCIFPKDGDIFNDAAKKLDGNADTYKRIYSSYGVLVGVLK